MVKVYVTNVFLACFIDVLLSACFSAFSEFLVHFLGFKAQSSTDEAKFWKSYLKELLDGYLTTQNNTNNMVYT